MLHELYSVCKYCLFNGFYLSYAILVFFVGFYASRRATVAAAPISNGVRATPPMPGGELPLFGMKEPAPFVATAAFTVLMNIASFRLFVSVIHSGLHFIKTVFLMSDNPTPLRSFWRYLNIYYLVIVLPAAFMPPVLDQQRSPDFHLLAAVVLLICVNALGDVVAVRSVLFIFKRLEPLERVHLAPDNLLQSIKTEATYYGLVVLAGLCSLAVLLVVLMFSSILYGVQVGQLDFAFSLEFAKSAIDRAIRFPELASKPYWFRGQEGPFGLPGIPGLFLYGLTTFIPVLILAFLAAAWLLLIPFRVAVNLPSTTRPVIRVISAEAAVLALCVSVSVLLRYADIL